jgi:hypothetical protein
MRGVIVDKILEIMKKSGSQSVFRPIMPAKIFTDLYQYYQASLAHTRNASIEMSLINETPGGLAGLSMNLMAPKL